MSHGAAQSLHRPWLRPLCLTLGKTRELAFRNESRGLLDNAGRPFLDSFCYSLGIRTKGAEGGEEHTQIKRRCLPSRLASAVLAHSRLQRLLQGRIYEKILFISLRLSVHFLPSNVPCGWLGMVRAPIDGPKPPVRWFLGLRRLSRRRLVGVSAGLFFFCCLFAETQCRAQDVAEAARQERARKASQQKQTKHVYTEDDLARAHILTPEDHAELEAKQYEKTLPPGEKPAEAANQSAESQEISRSAGADKISHPFVGPETNVQSLPPDTPLGDVARHYRKQKQERQAQQSAQFHLPFSDAPLASPKPPALPTIIVPPANRSSSAAPSAHPTKRSPFARPSAMQPPTSQVPMGAPSIPRRSINASPPSPTFPPVEPVKPAGRAAQPSARVMASEPSDVRSIRVQRGDSLWKLAQQNLGSGLRWHDLLGTNPWIHDPDRIAVGVQIYIPVRSSAHRKSSQLSKVKVQRRDTLWKIARAELGHGVSWPCIAQANPAVRNPNLIFEGQELLLPASCDP